MKTLSQTLAVFLVLVGLVLVNVIGSLLPGQLDLTAEKLYTLSPGSRAILERVEEPIELAFHYTRDLESLPPQFKAFAERIEAFLRQVERASGGKVSLVVVNPKPDTKEEESATRLGLSGQPLPSGETLFLGLAVTQADQREVIPVFTVQRERFVEYDILRAIHRVQLLDKPRLGIVTALPLFADFSNPMAFDPRNPPRDSVLVSELRGTFEVEQVTGDALPENLDVLAIIQPGSLSDQLAYAVDQFLLSGKPVFVAVDPVNEIQQRNQPPQMMFMGGGAPTSSDLPRLFPRWGVTFDATRVVGDARNAAQVQTGRGQVVRYPLWVSLAEFSSEEPVTGSLQNVLLVQPGAIDVDGTSGLALTPVLASSTEAGFLGTGELLGADPEGVQRLLKPDGVTRTFAGFLRGNLKSAFPDGRPAPAAPAEGETPPEPPPAGEHLAESKGPVTLFVIADADFLTDDFSVRRLDIFGTSAIQPLNDNLPLALNVLEALSGDDDLLSLRGGGTAARRFERVDAIQRDAEKAYNAQLEALEQRLNEVNERLAGIQQQAGDARSLLASPEVQSAIADFQRQQADLQGERREIRKKLREDIEALGTRLGLANVLPVPLLVALAGLAILVRRGRARR